LKDLMYSEILSEAWASIKGDLALAMGLTAVYAFGIWVAHFIPFANFIVIGPLVLGYFRCLLQIQAKQTIGYADFFWGFMDFNRLLHIVIMNAVLAAGIGIGMFLLIVPGIWFMVSSLFSSALFVTANQDGLEVIKQSMDLVKGRWWHIAGFAGLLFVLNFAGCLAFGIGALITGPVTALALINACRQLQMSEPLPATQVVNP